MLKLSGESLCPSGQSGIDHETTVSIAAQIKDVVDAGIQVSIVCGGGNIWRYRDNTGSGIERTESDSLGMLATVMNGVGLRSAFDTLDTKCKVYSAVDLPHLVEPFNARKARSSLEEGSVIVCVGGTGNPYFTTDSAAALRAAQLHCDALLKATTVDGVYDSDPDTNPDAVKYDDISYDEAIAKNLKVMDQTAFSLCQEAGIPIQVFDFGVGGNLLKAAKGDSIGTRVHS